MVEALTLLRSLFPLALMLLGRQEEPANLGRSTYDREYDFIVGK